MKDEQPQKPAETQEKSKRRSRPVTLYEMGHDRGTISRMKPEPAPFPTPCVAVQRDRDTEDLLNGLIAELHHFMRTVATPSACDTPEPSFRIKLIDATGDVALKGAALGEAVAKLRASTPQSPERHAQVIDAVAKIA